MEDAANSFFKKIKIDYANIHQICVDE